MKSIIILTFTASLALAIARGGEQRFESGNQRTHLLELFTSEGCSSCPPAEAWLSKLKGEPRLWKDFVPLAFHVDYWDRLGWKDPFAAKEWTARQYQYSTNWKSEGVYTPAFVLDGRELRNRVVPPAATEKPGVLKVSFATDKVTGEFHPAESGADRFDLYVATLGFDLRTKVTAGENDGRNLHHDFVVLSLTRKELIEGHAQLELAKTATPGQAIAAWLTKPGQLEPIQATGGWLK